MLKWIEMYEKTEEKLGRKLMAEERDFLIWVYDKYEKEQKETKLKAE